MASSEDVFGDRSDDAPDPASSAAGIAAQASAVGDGPSEKDELGFELYVHALANFLNAPRTRAPLTCSIEGTWGSGKSSFMRQLRKRLIAVAPDCRTIEFNAWKYDKQEELWAAFALKVTRSLREQMRWWDRIRGDASLFWKRTRGWGQQAAFLALATMWLLLIVGSASVFVWSVFTSHEERVHAIKLMAETKEAPKDGEAAKTTQPKESIPASASQQLWYERLAWYPLPGAILLTILIIGKLPESYRKRLFEVDLEKYIDRPDYKGKAAFVDSFSEDFAKVIGAYTPLKDAKVFVFIDDLDRCEAPKAADLMQAINLMIGDGNPIFFILGLDRAKVASAITFKFREIIPYLNPADEPSNEKRIDSSFGDAFLEKFIQLSFRLPLATSEQQARIFIDSLVSDAAESSGARTQPTDAETSSSAAAESTRIAQRIESGAESQRIRDVVMMVRQILDYSPRRIKNFLNALRLALYIASAQGLMDVDARTNEAEVTPERLGKFLALTTRYPEIRGVLDRTPDFIHQVELLARDVNDKKHASSEALTWLKKPGIEELLSYGVAPPNRKRPWHPIYSMKNFPIRKFDTILPGVPPPAASEIPLPQKPEPEREPDTEVEYETFRAQSSEAFPYAAPVEAVTEFDERELPAE